MHFTGALPKNRCRTLAAAIEVLEARIAPATFSWSATGSGNWNSAANWSLDDGVSALGFPDAPDDVAIFSLAGVSQTPRTVTIPTGFTITVGSVVFSGLGPDYTVAAAGSGRLEFDVSTGSAAISVTGGAHTISAPVLLSDSAATTVSGGSLAISGVISEAGGGKALTKSGTGTLQLAGAGANTFTGNLTVNDGTLELAKTAGVNAAGGGTVIVGDDTGAAQSATLRWLASNNVSDSVPAQVRGDGRLDLNGFDETLVSLTLASLATSGPLISTGAGTLAVNGAIVANGETPSLITGKLDVGATGKTFLVADGATLEVAATISGAGGITLADVGTLRLSGAAANTYTGTTFANTGTLELAKTAGANAFAGALTVGDGAGAAKSAIVEVAEDNNIPDTTVVTVNADGFFDLAGQIETIDSLVLNANAGLAPAVATGTGTLTLGTDFSSLIALTVNPGTTSQTVTLTGTFDFPGFIGTTQRIISVGDSVNTTRELEIAGVVSGDIVSLAKTGAGTLRLSGDTANTLAGSFDHSGGVLELAKNGANAIASALNIGIGAVRLFSSGNIADASAVSVSQGAVFDLNGNDDAIGALTLATGSGAAAQVLTGAGTLTLSGNVTLNILAGATAPATISGKLDLGSAMRTFNIADSASATDLDVSAAISGTGGFTKTGAGRLRLSGATANTFTGTTTATGGFLDLDKTAGVAALDGSLAVGDGTTGGFVAVLSAGNLPDDTSVTINAASTLVLVGVDETIGALTMIASDTSTAGVQTGSGTLTLTGDVSVPVVGSGSFRPIIIGKLALSGTRTFDIGDGSDSVDLSLSAGIGGTGSLIKTGAGTLQFASGGGANTYTGNTTVSGGTLLLENSSGTAIPGTLSVASSAGTRGTVRLSVDNQIADAASVTIGPGGSLDLNGRNETLAGLNFTASDTAAGTVSTGAGTLTLTSLVQVIPQGGTTTQLAPVISGKLALTAGSHTVGVFAQRLTIAADISGSGEVVKSGGGALTLTGANTYTGATSVTSGVLQVDGSLASAVALTAGTLRGSGTIASLNATGGRIEPGASPAVLASAGALTLGAGSTSVFEIGGTAPGTQHDQFTAGGAVTLGGTLRLVTTGTIAKGDTFKIIDGPGAAITGTFAGLVEGATLFGSDRTFTISYAGGDVVVTAGDPIATIAANGRSATFPDADGDLVKLVITRGRLQLTDLVFAPNAAGTGVILTQLALTRAEFAGTKVTFSAKPTATGGNSRVDVGFINADGTDLAAVKVPGDLGRIVAGNADEAKRGLGSLSVGSLGVLGLVTQDGTGSLASSVRHGLGSLKIAGDLAAGATLDVTGALKGRVGNVKIGGSLLRTAGEVGELTSDAGFGPIKIGGDPATPGTGLLGQITSRGGNIGAVRIGGDFGGTIAASILAFGGGVASVTVGGSMLGNSILRADTTLGPVLIHGDIAGLSPTSVALITAFGKATAPTRGGDVAIASLRVEGDVTNASILAGATVAGASPLPLNADASIGPVTVLGDWTASSLRAGTSAGPDVKIGTDDDISFRDVTGDVTIRDNAKIVARLARLTILGTTTGTAAPTTDSFGIVAEQIVKAKIGTTVLALTAGPNSTTDVFALSTEPGPTGGTFDFNLREAV